MKTRIEQWAQELEDKADVARWFPLSIIGWTFSIVLRACARVLP